MDYKVETHFGCTSNAIIINGQNYSCEDPRYQLTDLERERFNDALLDKIVHMFNTGELGPLDLIQLLPSDNVEYSDTCEQCGDTVVSTFYSF